MKVYLIFNAGSSSIKFSLFDEKKLDLIIKGALNDIQNDPELIIKNAKGEIILSNNRIKQGYENGLNTLNDYLHKQNNYEVTKIGHRVVHGGRIFSKPIIITKEILKKLKSLIPLAPLHQGHNIEAIELCQKMYPKTPQIACFDTAFHRTQSTLSQTFAIPEKYTKEGVIRYGFHGLSYEYITLQLPKYIKNFKKKKIIIAHLGNGASLCAIKNGKSIATTMGLSTLDGLMMGTRCGAIDPGVIIYLMEEKKMKIKEIEHLLYHESGLKGVSEINNDMQDLLNNKSPKAKFTIDLFCHQATKQLLSLLVDLQGLDCIIFTGGIGENAKIIRDKITNHVNKALKKTIKNYIIPTNEELMIAKHTKKEK